MNGFKGYEKKIGLKADFIALTIGAQDGAVAMKVETILETNRSVLASFCRKHHITRLSLFGSTLKGEATASSDIDLLVEFHTDHIGGKRTVERSPGAVCRSMTK